MQWWLISDNHFHHFNMIAYENRPFKDCDEMNEYMIDRWNTVISNDDTVFHLGDFSFGSFGMIKKIFDRLNGNKILIMGNHDRHRSVGFWKRIGFIEVYKRFYELPDVILSHEPVRNTTKNNIHGHIHSKTLDLNKPIYRSNFKYYNASVEILDYTPIKFEYVINLLS